MLILYKDKESKEELKIDINDKELKSLSKVLKAVFSKFGIKMNLGK